MESSWDYNSIIDVVTIAQNHNTPREASANTECFFEHEAYLARSFNEKKLNFLEIPSITTPLLANSPRDQDFAVGLQSNAEYPSPLLQFSTTHFLLLGNPLNFHNTSSSVSKTKHKFPPGSSWTSRALIVFVVAQSYWMKVK